MVILTFFYCLILQEALPLLLYFTLIHFSSNVKKYFFLMQIKLKSIPGTIIKQ